MTDTTPFGKHTSTGLSAAALEVLEVTASQRRATANDVDFSGARLVSALMARATSGGNQAADEADDLPPETRQRALDELRAAGAITVSQSRYFGQTWTVTPAGHAMLGEEALIRASVLRSGSTPYPESGASGVLVTWTDTEAGDAPPLQPPLLGAAYVAQRSSETWSGKTRMPRGPGATALRERWSGALACALAQSGDASLAQVCARAERWTVTNLLDWADADPAQGGGPERPLPGESLSGESLSDEDLLRLSARGGEWEEAEHAAELARLTPELARMVLELRREVRTLRG